MKKTLFLVLMIAYAISSIAIAARLPSHYPTQGFENTGVVDVVYAEENRIVINDISYQISSSVAVHSLSSNKASLTRVRKGAHVAFRLGKNEVIEEFWLLPSNYE